MSFKSPISRNTVSQPDGRATHPLHSLCFRFELAVAYGCATRMGPEIHALDRDWPGDSGSAIASVESFAANA
jgi:hypothetical protein